jgi:hypothetical protein
VIQVSCLTFILFYMRSFTQSAIIMRLVTSSTSLAASQALIRSSYNSAIASDVDHAYNLEVKQSETRNSLSIECSFVVSSSLRGDNIDAGILKCSDPNYICVEDVNSSLGGRCVAAIATKQRMLQNTPNPCTRCYGGGCDGLSDEFITNNVGEGSCCGAYACVGATSKYSSNLEAANNTFLTLTTDPISLKLAQIILSLAQALVSDTSRVLGSMVRQWHTLHFVSSISSRSKDSIIIDTSTTQQQLELVLVLEIQLRVIMSTMDSPVNI